MAETTIKNISKRSILRIKAFPVLAGEYIYQGTIACIIGATGFLANVTSARIAAGISMIGIVSDSSENANLTAPSANGSISGDDETASGLSNGEKTVRRLWTEGEFRVVGSGFAQSSIGKILYVTDNFTFTLNPINAVPVGLITEYVSSTVVWFDLNNFGKSQHQGFKYFTKALVAADDETAGAVASIANPLGRTIIVQDILIDVTVAPTDTAGGIDAGIAANGSTSSDTLIDGAVLAAAGVFCAANNAGTNGGLNRKMTASQYITITSSVVSHYDLTALVGNVTVVYREVQ